MEIDRSDAPDPAVFDAEAAGSLSIAAIVPCYNEEAAIAGVVADLRLAVPTMDIYVYDNNSTDRTAEVAAGAGAIVRHEYRKGKGNVVRRAFADIDADVYVMIDGDGTYETKDLAAMIELLLAGPFDHVLGCRQDDEESSNYRPGHAAGNKAFNGLVSRIFGENVTDMFSGYRVFSRRFVKSFPATSREFEIETELTVHIMSLRVPSAEYPCGFHERVEGTESKLNTFSDGRKILVLIWQLCRHERPIMFYGCCALIALIISLIVGVPVVLEFMGTHLVPRLPSALLATGLMLISFVMWMLGMILDGIRKNRSEMARLFYLRHDAPSNGSVQTSKCGSAY
ncbi:glycosyltransferase [Propionibacterium sp.]|uniref:glycosyltransferase n=1 Tax=Propionibacterium sp. TaxID=1977903 RepID=UPI0039EC1900